MSRGRGSVCEAFSTALNEEQHEFNRRKASLVSTLKPAKAARIAQESFKCGIGV
jgi:hypothetical protein